MVVKCSFNLFQAFVVVGLMRGSIVVFLYEQISMVRVVRGELGVSVEYQHDLNINISQLKFFLLSEIVSITISFVISR